MREVAGIDVRRCAAHADIDADLQFLVLHVGAHGRLIIAQRHGAVQRPGYYYTAADIPLSDVIMKSGGPAGNADFGKISVRRADEVIWNAKDTRTAMADGLSIDRLHMRAGDEIHIAEQRHFPWMTVLTVAVPSLIYLATLLR